LKVITLVLALLGAWMVLKIRFRTLKFYLKNYISCERKEKKRKAFAKTCNGSDYCKGDRMPVILSFWKSFVRIVGQLHSFENLDPRPQKTESLQAFVKFSYDCYVVGKRIFIF